MSDSALREAREQLTRTHLDAEVNHRMDGVVATFRDHHGYYDIAAFPEPVDGGDAVAAFVSDMFRAFPDWGASLTGPLIHCDTGVFVELRMTGTQKEEWIGIPSSGGQMDVRVACMYDFDGQDLVAERVWFDMATVMRQLGALPG